MAKPRAHRLLFASVAGVAQRLAQVLASLVILPLALHGLGVAGFGVWGAATSLLSLAGMLSFGLGAALVALLPRALAVGAHEDGRAQIAAALFGGAALAAGVLVGGGVVLLGGWARLSPPFLIAAVALIVNIPLSIGPDIWFGLQKGHVAALWALVQTVLGLAGLVAGVGLGAGVVALVAVFYGALLLANAGCLAHVLLAHRHLRPSGLPPRAVLGAVFGKSGLFSLATAAAMGIWVFDNIMALSWLGPAASAQMAVALRVCTTATGLLWVFTQPFWPGFADALAVGDHGWVRKMLWRGLAATLGLSVGGALLIVLFGRPVLIFWLHSDLHLGMAMMWAMAGWIVALTLTNVPGVLLSAAHRIWPQIWVYGVAALLGFGAKYLLAPRFGVVGVLAVAPVVWVLWTAPMLGWFTLRTLRRMDEN
ncbi:lipopolysaccharide biosynthesis protein [Acidocella sp.]|uniref:lipopolysaccharide biosynthesis protein n=1 Tax=Acidocella sp. TaxID=50710 RepID=UPI002625A98B|nr:lipopolysaccharide biosynthesis protein [Acidocella sp.]